MKKLIESDTAQVIGACIAIGRRRGLRDCLKELRCRLADSEGGLSFAGPSVSQPYPHVLAVALTVRSRMCASTLS